MARWTDLAEWRGPTPNQGGGMVEHRGVVVHIAEGSFEGTIAWQKNPAADVSSHFVVDYDGRIAQVVDTDTAAWTQAAGNGHWLSVENAGFHTGQLTPQQVEANAQLLARAHRDYGVPLQVTNSTSGSGLGWHGMGGAAWGGHPDCPGPDNVALLPQIVARAQQIVNGSTPPLLGEDDDMFMLRDANGFVAKIDGVDPVTRKVRAYGIATPEEFDDLKAAGIPVRQVNYINPDYYVFDPPAPAGGGGSGLTYEQTVAAAQEGAERAEDS